MERESERARERARERGRERERERDQHIGVTLLKDKEFAASRAEGLDFSDITAEISLVGLLLVGMKLVGCAAT